MIREIREKREIPKTREIEFEGIEGKFKIEQIKRLGIGGEAEVFQCRLLGPAKEIEIIASKRYSGDAPQVFISNLICYLIDEYARKNGEYQHQHVPTPIGVCKGKITTAYLYKYVKGRDGFSWVYPEREGKRDVKLMEWDKFVGFFYSAGIDISYDTTDALYANTSKNVVLEDYDYNKVLKTGQLSPHWMRIDYGSRSIQIYPERLMEFVKENKKDLKEKLGWKAKFLEYLVSLKKEKDPEIQKTKLLERPEFLKKHLEEVLKE